MKKFSGLLLVVLLIASVAMVGCTQKEESPKAAIEKAQTMDSPEKQADYLVSQANAFYRAKEYKEAIQLANKTLSLDANSAEAKKVIEKAKADLSAQAEKAAADAKKKLGL